MRYWVPPEAGLGGPGLPEHGYPPEKKEDKEISEAVRLALFLDPDIDEKQFSIRTEDGVVYLSGFAKSEDERQRVYNLALGVEGVHDVIDQVRLVSE
ncbi:MAG: BON domain-containing protein [Chloroflexi bacterium]|nr:BON domain-containing protein [Chloroflexota bacterium]MDA8187386.1 BON domain-containing protein [Dehalococcoidales bacterium]